MTRRSNAAQLVGPGEIARALGVERGTVLQWWHRDLLPEPLAQLDIGRGRTNLGDSAGMPVWEWSTIAAWADETGREIVAEP
jgi:hypothetical protein